jgi:hydroxymethylbilane synthase
LRGNIATRLARTADVDAVVVAQAALDRLGLVPDVVDPLDPGVLLPQVAQGALAVECRADDATTAALLSGIENSTVRLAVDAERGFLAELGSGCDLPVAAHARVLDDGSVGLTGAISSPEGDTLLLETRQGTDPETVGRALARHLLDERGGAALLGPA